MEEDIKIIEEMLRLNKNRIEPQIVQAIKNLINKYKEQEKIIELMAKDIAEKDIDEDICKKVGKNPFCDEYGEESKCVECVIEYYKKKALEV